MVVIIELVQGAQNLLVKVQFNADSKMAYIMLPCKHIIQKFYLSLLKSSFVVFSTKETISKDTIIFMDY